MLETEFGPLAYRKGDWVYIPKACTFRQVPDAESTWLMIQATEEFRVPPAGALGRHFPFDPSQIVIPDPAPLDDGVGPQVDGEYEVRLVHSEVNGAGTTSLFYQHHPLDVEGWQGDNFPFTFNIEDYHVITSDSVHLPPTVHLFMQATGVYVMNFLPKRAESVRVPNARPGITQSRLRRDRVLSRWIAVWHPDAARPGFTCAARGSPRCARKGARASQAQVRRLRQSRLSVIAIDTRRRLVPSAEVLANDLGQH